jgi:hypothetical protein
MVVDVGKQSVQALIDTALESRALLSNAVSMSVWKQRRGEWLAFKSARVS